MALRLSRPPILLWVILIVLTMGWTSSWAQTLPGGGLSVSPVRIDFAKDVDAETVQVSNPGESPMTVQVRLFSWTTNGEEDVYTLSKDIGFSPAIFTLEPKMNQTVRLVKLSKSATREANYRLFVDELPVAATQSGVQMPVRMILPVFVAPSINDRPPTPALRWSAAYDPTEHKVKITVANDGQVHDKIIDLSCVVDGVKHSVRPGLSGYALAGQSRSWSIALPSAPRDLIIEARDESKPITAHILVTP